MTSHERPARPAPGSTDDGLTSWSTRAVNLPEHADNPIHTDDGARAAGFEAALVAGVTVYGYLTHVPATGWGTSWLSGGGAEVRFRAPVLDGDLVQCVAVGGGAVEARVDGSMRASCAFVDAADPLPFRSGEPLVAIEVVVDEDMLDVGLRSGDDCPIYLRDGIAHPSVWPKLANRFFHDQLVSGAWIHVRSRIAHHGVARLGSTLTADANVIERFDSRAGRRAIVDVAIRADGALVATLEHEAIIEVA